LDSLKRSQNASDKSEQKTRKENYFWFTAVISDSVKGTLAGCGKSQLFPNRRINKAVVDDFHNFLQLSLIKFFDGTTLYYARSVQLTQRTKYSTQNVQQKITSGLLSPSWKHHTQSSQSQTVAIHAENTFHREPLLNTSSGLLPPRWKMVEIDQVSLKQS